MENKQCLTSCYFCLNLHLQSKCKSTVPHDNLITVIAINHICCNLLHDVFTYCIMLFKVFTLHCSQVYNYLHRYLHIAPGKVTVLAKAVLVFLLRFVSLFLVCVWPVSKSFKPHLTKSWRWLCLFYSWHSH